MKTKNMLWAALSMTAALVMTACSNDDNMTETPQAPSISKTIPYTATVNDGATTRATVDSDNKTLRFATGDKLYITGTNIQGVLDIQTGVGETSGATFSGDLNYTGEGSPAADLELTATLVSAQQAVGTQVSVDAAGAVTVNYPSTAYCADVATAVQEYSRLTGTSRYDTKSFTLSQQTAFLNFVITFEDGTDTGTALSAVVNNNSADICTANVTTTKENTKVVAKFVLPVASGTVLSSAKVTMGSKAAISFGASQTLDGKVYNVKKTYYKLISAATSSDKGKVVCAAGHLHTAKTAVPTGCTAVGILGKVSSTGHGLILALSNASSQTWVTINNWSDVTTYASTTLKLLPSNARSGLGSYTTLGTTTVSNWAVAQMSDYSTIFQNLSSTNSGSYYGYDDKVNAYFINNGSLLTGRYWTATKYSMGYNGWAFSDTTPTGDANGNTNKVRPVLGF